MCYETIALDKYCGGSITCNDDKFPNVKYEIYFDFDFDDRNSEWVYQQWMQDHGWRVVSNEWKGNGYSRDTVVWTLYIDPYEKVVICFYANDSYQVFRIGVLKD
ncbi:MAG: hypothetical protein Ta2B_16210 [Termitinemataceae bacterium]|nr:MAG: hypothetical protein Ta2B_16210 [Termitinemataceae bacterium]